MSRSASTSTKFRTAKLDQGLACESASEKENSRRIFAIEKRQCSSKFASRRLCIRRALGDEPQVQMGHGEPRVQVGGSLIMLHGADWVASMLPAKGH